jgi:hypothetical protein
MEHLSPYHDGCVHLYFELKRCDAALSGTATACPAASTKLMPAYTKSLETIKAQDSAPTSATVLHGTACVCRQALGKYAGFQLGQRKQLYAAR